MTEGLEGPYWKLTRLASGPIPSIAPPREPFLQFDGAARHLSGCAGCNRIMGGYEREGDQLRFGVIASTMMFCEETMEVEQAFLQALPRVRGFRIRGSTLELLNEKGELEAQFERQAGPPAHG